MYYRYYQTGKSKVFPADLFPIFEEVGITYVNSHPPRYGSDPEGIDLNNKAFRGKGISGTVTRMNLPQEHGCLAMLVMSDEKLDESQGSLRELLTHLSAFKEVSSGEQFL